MNFTVTCFRGLFPALFAALLLPLCGQDLPLAGTPQKPLLLLQLGNAPAKVAADHLRTCTGTTASADADVAVSSQADTVTVARKGLGKWSASFRFALPPEHPSGEFTFWARWRQGGDPNVCPQSFAVFAGPDADSLEARASMTLRSPGWKFAWVDGKKLQLKENDRVLEIRNSGQAQDAKVFSAFLLGGPRPPPPPVPLPVAASAEHPIVLLGFGKRPLNRDAAEPGAQLRAGTVSAGAGAERAAIAGTTANVFHKGFGDWGAAFRFELGAQPVEPGYYSFQARYMCGGEPSQVRQTFVLRAGPDAATLGRRGSFQTVNKTPFQQAWLAGKGTFAVFPGDRVLEIVNSGKAHDVKVFEGFMLVREAPMPAWLSAERARWRSQFLAAIKPPAQTTRTLYVLDGDGPGDEALFGGLAQVDAQPFYEALQVNYLAGAEAAGTAADLNLPGLPAAVLTNADRQVLGVLHRPASAGQVARFLAAPETGGPLPEYAAGPAAEPVPLPASGVPQQWLVGVNWPGQTGVGRWGLDAEATQRPNPGEMIAYGYYTAGNRRGEWTERAPTPDGAVTLTERLDESYAWGKATNYAVLYLHADKEFAVRLHLHHSGIRSALYLDGSELPLALEGEAPFAFARRPAPTAAEVVERAGQEIHDDVAVPGNAEAPRLAVLPLRAGWHCLILKLVHAQGKGERVVFAARFDGADGAPPAGLRTLTRDPDAVPGLTRAAAGLWPTLTLAGVPGNLPRPGEPLTVVADLRVTPSFLAAWCPPAFLPIAGKLRLRLADYDGKEVRTVAVAGRFPAVVTVDLGPAPGPGYYTLTPELVTADGRLIRRYYADGFSVVLGNQSQQARVDRKKLMNSWYYAFNDWESFAPWLERTGLFKNVGSIPGLSGKDLDAKWADAKARGIVLFADFAGDSNWLNNDAKAAEGLVALAAPYTRYFKGINEIDGRFGGDEGVAWQVSRQPEQYVARTRWQYEAVHRARPDAIHFGGSVYTSGNSRSRADHPEIPGPREWLRQCLALGLDACLDAWDVHAYPQYPPRLEAESVSNSPRETDLGVRDVYREAGIPFHKPFLLGETSAMVFHGFTGLRWQADTLTKMVAWCNSRPDWLGMALCAAHHDRRKTAEEYAMARNPGEAAIYTAGALIDGLDYRRAPAADAEVQAAWFGGTFLIWRADDQPGTWSMALDPAREWLLVDVVGRARPLAVENGQASFAIGTSPVYVLSRQTYADLTR